ncbi:MAG: hypothetical protein HC895_12135 [Leptolyngbyaceae cyanobacterium SM1_3_5]|nr:hypothetical protein [Leptolyngbyaceae cyanobacterium SM1_3_5]
MNYDRSFFPQSNSAVENRCFWQHFCRRLVDRSGLFTAAIEPALVNCNCHKFAV